MMQKRVRCYQLKEVLYYGKRGINDPLGSPLILMGKDGNIVKRYRFDPFGNLDTQ